MAIEESAASEQSPLIPPSLSSTTEVEESVSISTASQPQTDEERRISPLRGIVLGACIAILIFLQTANFSLMTTIQSSIAVDLDAFQNASWFTSTYLIAGASITPLAGRLCQIFSPRAYVLVSCFIMASGALVTSLAPRLAVFLVGRALNGVGGAAVFPVSLILIIELTSVKRRGLCIGCVNTCYTIGVAWGAIIAGALDAVVGWRGIFALQVPLAITMGFGVFLAIPSSTFAKRDDPTNQEPLVSRLSHIDFLGLFLLVSTIVLFLYGLSTPNITYSTIVASGFTLLAFLFVENSKNLTSQPILPLSVLRSRAVLLTCLSTLLAMVARWSILFYTPVYALSVRSFHPAQAGLILLPTNGGFALGNLLLGYFHVRRVGSFYTSCLVAYALFATSVLVLSKITTREASMVGYFFVAGWNGFMIGASMIYTLTHVLHRTSKDSHFIISGLIAMFRGLSASFGSAIGGGMFARILKEALEKGFQEKGVPLEGKRDLIRRLLGSPALVGKLMGIEKEVATDGYVVALRTLFATAAIVAVMATLVQAGTGWSAVQEEEDGKSARLQESDTETVIDEENVQIGAGQD